MKLLDTSAWVEYFKGSTMGEAVKRELSKEAATSAITLAEISSWFTKNKGDVSVAIEHIKRNSIIIGLEEDILVESGKLYINLRSSRTKIGLIDAMIYMTAQIHGLSLLTSDSDFRGLPQVEMLG
ncbi:PIN domain-containing protein [Candidatus Woesearchaeota archaeon]|nr:PIN domain-containing protein [Candidatus Woesearchaeota archaeon]